MFSQLSHGHEPTHPPPLTRVFSNIIQTPVEHTPTPSPTSSPHQLHRGSNCVFIHILVYVLFAPYHNRSSSLCTRKHRQTKHPLVLRFFPSCPSIQLFLAPTFRTAKIDTFNKSKEKNHVSPIGRSGAAIGAISVSQKSNKGVKSPPLAVTCSLNFRAARWSFFCIRVVILETLSVLEK